MVRNHSLVINYVAPVNPFNFWTFSPRIWRCRTNVQYRYERL